MTAMHCLIMLIIHAGVQVGQSDHFYPEIDREVSVKLVVV